MSYSRPQRHRQDGNQKPLVDLFEQLGGLWIPYASKPFDGWAWHPGWQMSRFAINVPSGYMPVEIKLAKREGHADEYTPRQRKVMEMMLRAGARWLVWRTDEDVYACVGARRAA